MYKLILRIRSKFSQDLKIKVIYLNFYFENTSCIEVVSSKYPYLEHDIVICLYRKICSFRLGPGNVNSVT